MFLVLHQVLLGFCWTMWPISIKHGIKYSTSRRYDQFMCWNNMLLSASSNSECNIRKSFIIEEECKSFSNSCFTPLPIVDDVGKLECPVCNGMLVRALVSGLATFAELFGGLLQISIKFCY